MESLEAAIKENQKLQRHLDARDKRIRMLKHTLKSVVDNIVDYTGVDVSSGKGFNGQVGRQAIFKDVCEAMQPAAIVETGTWTGETTGHMALTAGRPVHTCEMNETFLQIAQRRLTAISDISFSLSDSREFLKMCAEPDRLGGSTPLFFYLDAHWHDDLPLAGELEIISNAWAEVAIMIDDFCVEDDPEYGYDDYGVGKALNLQTFGEQIHRLGFSAFSPTLAGAQETGKQRGSIVLGSGAVAATLSDVKSLRKAEYP